MRAALPLLALAAQVTALVAALVTCSCGHDEPVASGARASTPQRVAGSPHGGAITAVAATDHGDAALTLDNLGALRLWPTLDGSREAIPVAASAAPHEIALAHAGSDLLAAIADDAGGATLLVVSRDGAMRRRVQLSADVAIEQVAAIDGGVLVRRRDQTLELYDASGARESRLAALPGERIAAIAVRQGGAIAAIAGDAKGITTLRRLALAPELRWGDPITLRQPILPDVLALSPDHQRVAFALERTSELAVATLGEKGPPAVRTSGINATASSAGFIDNDHVAIAGATLQWWSAVVDHDPWSNTTQQRAAPSSINNGAFAVADHLALTGFSAGLALGDAVHVRYLGWSELPGGTDTMVGAKIAMGPVGTRYTWLDDHLAELHSFELPKSAEGGVQQVIALDDHAVILDRYEKEHVVELIDSRRPNVTTPVGTFPQVQRMDYAPEAHVLAITTPQRIERFLIDPDHRSVLRIAGGVAAAGYSFVRPLDPARAGGAVLVAVTTNGVVETFRDASFKARDLDRASSFATTHSPLAIDATGAAYFETAQEPLAIVQVRGGKELGRFMFKERVGAAAVSQDGASLALVTGHAIVVTDSKGVERWRYAEWSPISVQFTADDRHVLLHASGGAILLDAATGRVVARSCGWRFGLYDEPLPLNTPATKPVCED